MFVSQVSRNVFSSGRCLKIALNIRGYEAARYVTGIAAEKHENSELATAKPFEEVPRRLMLPFIGTGWTYLPFIGKYSLKKLHEADFDKHKVYGDVVREKFFNLDAVCSFDPNVMELLFRHEGTNPVRSELTSFKAYRESRKEWYKTGGLLVLQGEEWADLRKKTQKHLMKPRSIQAYLDPMQDIARDLVKRILELRDSNKEVPKLLDELYKWALESIACVGLDARLGCLDGNIAADADGKKMIDSVQTQFECINKLEAYTGNIQFWKLFPTPTWKKFTRAGDAFTEIAFKYINRSLEQLKKNVDSDKDLTLLQAMLMTKGMDASRAMVMVADMLTAGIDTTSHTVGFLLYHLAKNPDKQEKAYKEIKQLLPNKNDKITPENLQDLHYLKACLKETLRLNPVLRGNTRILDHDVVISGYRVPAGVTIFCALHVVYRNEKYFKDPNKFLPERWLDKDKDINPFSYAPFGVGTRSCIGRRLAELEIFCITSEILRNFELEYHHEDIGIETRFVNIPDKPLRFSFLDR